MVLIFAMRTKWEMNSLSEQKEKKAPFEGWTSPTPNNLCGWFLFVIRKTIHLAGLKCLWQQEPPHAAVIHRSVSGTFGRTNLVPRLDPINKRRSSPLPVTALIPAKSRQKRLNPHVDAYPHVVWETWGAAAGVSHVSLEYYKGKAIAKVIALLLM